MLTSMSFLSKCHFFLSFAFLLAASRVGGKNTVRLDDGVMVAAVGFELGKEIFLDVPFTLSNATLAASFAIAEMCATVEGTEPYCTDPIFYKHIFEYTMTILKFGHRIVDIDYEMNRRWVMRDKLSVAVDELPTKHVLFLQVGAHVGALDNDPIFPLLVSNTLARGILLEPGDVQFAGLSYNYQTVPIP